eukprot:scaffold1541_cov67-Phaeocystis_antarctica.AAC.8
MLPRLLSLGVEGRRVGDLGRASRPHRSPPVGPWVARWLVPSAQRSHVRGEPAPGGRGNELWHCQDGTVTLPFRLLIDPRRPGTRSRRACCPPPRSAARSAQPPAAAACLSRPSSYEAHQARAPRAPRPKRACRPALARAARAAGAPAHWQAGRALASQRCHR